MMDTQSTMCVFEEIIMNDSIKKKFKPNHNEVALAKSILLSFLGTNFFSLLDDRPHPLKDNHYISDHFITAPYAGHDLSMLRLFLNNGLG